MKNMLDMLIASSFLNLLDLFSAIVGEDNSTHSNQAPSCNA